MVTAGCGGGDGASPEPAAESRPAPPVVDLDAVPPVDLSRHSVELSDVVFDTFDGRFARLPKTSVEARRRLMDRIPPIYEPGYGDESDLPWLADGDLVVGYVSARGTYAYPVKVLNFRELVNDEIDGVPILISYCPLCASAVVYSRRLEGRTLLFGNTSALYQSDLVMFDHETGSYWFQVQGEAIVGQLTGRRLRPLPSTIQTWGEWKRLHPETRLLVSDAGQQFDRQYADDPFVDYPGFVDSGQFPFPVSKERIDKRLRAAEVVIAVEVDSAAKAYPPRLVGDAAVNDEVGGRQVVVFSRSTGFVASAFIRTVGGRALTFRFENGAFVDQETGSTWNAAGQATAGPLQGKQLEPLAARRGFWFAIALANPKIDLFVP